MARYRKVKKYGNTFVIPLKSNDIKDLNIKLGDLIDIEEAVFKSSVPESLTKLTKKRK